jgi:hypothetical protein
MVLTDKEKIRRMALTENRSSVGCPDRSQVIRRMVLTENRSSGEDGPDSTDHQENGTD